MLPFDPAHLPAPGNPVQMDRGFERWRAVADRLDDPADRRFAVALADSVDGRRLLSALFGNSAFLTDCAVREPRFIRRLCEQGCRSAIDLAIRTAADLAPGTPTAELMRHLRVAKRQVALGLGMADIAQVLPLTEITASLSAFASVAIDRACAHLLARAAGSGDLVLAHPDDPCCGSGLVILGMGKLGARELNYSSDIDLILLYDEDIVKTPRPDHLARTFIRIARELVRVLEERTADGYVFRTDLRLRPDPAATPLAVSVTAAETYYGSVGQNWERAAMIKARPVAGDLDAGRSFIDGLRGFIWRRHLDFAAVQDIHSIKRQINAHRGHTVVAINGHDVKVGRGGIREIEFFAQTQQLIFGGRDPSLRVAGTLDALQALVAANRVDPATADRLSRAYVYLRTVEHRLQMVEDRQTHALPADDAGVDAISVFLGYADPASFRRTLRAHLEAVQACYAALFEEAPDLSGPGNLVFTGPEDDPETLATLGRLGYANPSGIAAAVRGWHHGRYRSTRSTRARELLTELIPRLLERLGQTPNPDQTFASFDQMLAGLPAGVPLFSLFCGNPELLDLVADLLGTAPRFAEALARRPTLLDTVLELDFRQPTPHRSVLLAELSSVLAAVHSYEEALDAARRWVIERQFRVAVQVLRGDSDPEAAGLALAAIADAAMAGILSPVRSDFERRHGRVPGGSFALVALGKLGERRMSFNSDLDLIAIYDAPDGQVPSDGQKPLSASEYFIRLVSRLTTAVTALTAEGRMFELDLRLRPSGNKGPLAVSLDGFVTYQQSSAWTWEHQALVRARTVVGDESLCERIANAIRDVLTRPRDPEGLLRDVADMRRRIALQHSQAERWDMKHRKGGLVDAEFVAQYLALRHAAATPEILKGETGAILEAARTLGHLEPDHAAALVQAVSLCRRVQSFLRLVSNGPFDPLQAPAALKRALVRSAVGQDIDFSAFETILEERLDRAHAAYLDIIDHAAARLPPKLESPPT